VKWSEGGVVVKAGGTEIGAGACVIATPAPHALELEWDPPLPAWKREALAGVRYGQAAKLFLPLAAPEPPSQTLSVPLRFWTWTQHGMPVASSFAGSPSALEQLEIDRGPTKWVAAVRELRPDLEYADGSPLLSTWHDDPWARGAYSARTLSSPLADEELARAVGVLTFAGEHTAGRWHGLMEGALRSGLRAAAEVEELLAAR
jgi:monoamine oxidase